MTLILSMMGAAVGGLPLLGSSAAVADSGCFVNTLLVNSCRPWFGAAAFNYPQVASDKLSQLRYFETRAGRQMDIVHTYHNAADSVLSSTDLTFAARPDTYLFTNWKVADVWADANGSNPTVNARIDSMAASIKSLGRKKIFLTIMHEPENDLTGDPNCPTLKYVGTAGTPADYKAMWANVRSRFDAAGVTNVVWAMDFMNYPGWNCVEQDVYPGDSLVDWILFNSYHTGDTKVSFVDDVSNLYTILTTNSTSQHDYLSKPWGIAEWGIRASTQASAYLYDSQAQAAVESNTFPKLKMLVAFDQNSPQTGDGSLRVGYDKSGATDASEQAAFNRFATSPALTGSATYVGDDVTPPSVSLDAPAAGSTVRGVVTVTGTAGDDTALGGTTLLVDGQQVGTSSGASPSVDWSTTSVAEGPHSLVLRTQDQNGHTTDSAAVAVTVQNVIPDTTPPSAPATSATLSGATAARITWSAATDDTGVVSYQVYRDGVLLAGVDGGTTGYSDGGLTDARSYSYTVTASDAAGNVSPQGAAAVVATPDTTAPSAPTGLTASATAGQVTLGWSDSSDNVGVAGYLVARGGVPVATTTEPGYVDSGLQDATAYQYTVTAVDAAGNTSAAATIGSTTLDATAPTVPTGLAAVGGNRQVGLTWSSATDNAGVTGYLLYRNGVLVATTVSTGFADSGLGELTSYAYGVAAVDAAGNVGPTAAVTVTTLDTTAPTAPGSLTAKLSGTSVALSWKAATDAGGVTSYAVLRNGVQVTTTAALTYVDTSAPQGVPTVYTVRAADAAGNVGVVSNSATVTVADKTRPTAPPGLTAVPGTKKVTLTWGTSTDNVGVIGYYVLRGGVRIATLAPSVLTYTDSGLTTKTTYSYQLQAFDAAGNKSVSSTASAKAK